MLKFDRSQLATPLPVAKLCGGMSDENNKQNDAGPSSRMSSRVEQTCLGSLDEPGEGTCETCWNEAGVQNQGQSGLSATDDSTNTPSKGWSELPENLFEVIVNRLCGRDVTTVRLVCKEWLRCSNQTLHRLEPVAVRLLHVVATFPSLQVLELRSTAEKFEVDLTPVTGLSRLRSLNLQGDIPMSAKGLVTVHSLKKLKKLKSLTNLRLSCFHIGEGETLRSVALLNNLKTLSLCGSKEVTNPRLKAVARMSQLVKLNLSGCDRVTSEGIALLSVLPQLTALDVSFCRGIGDKIQEALTRLPNLAYLDMSACCRITNVGIAPVQHMSGLHVLKLSSCYEITDAGLRGVRGLEQLEVLDVSACAEISDTGLEHLKGCKSLASLDVSHCSKITNNGLPHLIGLERLTALNVSSCGDVSDEGMQAIARRTSLKRLDVGGCEISDAGVLKLSEITGLRCLLLNHCKRVTGDSILVLFKRCEKLSKLHIKGCNGVAASVVEELKRDGRMSVVHMERGDVDETESANIMDTGISP